MFSSGCPSIIHQNLMVSFNFTSAMLDEGTTFVFGSVGGILQSGGGKHPPNPS
jgi:hypothetical protein